MSKKKVGGEIRNAPISIKATADLKARLEDAAARSGRSLAQDVERRLEQSLRDNPAGREPWSDATWNYSRIVGECLTSIEKALGHRWIETKSGCEAARAVVEEIFRELRPVLSDQKAMTATEAEEAKHLSAVGVATARFLTFRTDLDQFQAEHPGVIADRSVPY